jgi:serine phosphatase RsbU (regulator of sigma subunit)
MSLPQPRLNREPKPRGASAAASLNPDTAVAVFRTAFVASVVVALWVRGYIFDFFNPAYVVSVLVGLYNAALLVVFLRHRYLPFRGPRQFTLTLDIVFVTLWVGVSGDLGPVFFPLYYALVVIAALWFGTPGSALTAFVSAGLYVAVLATAPNAEANIRAALAERLPFLFVVAVLVGLIADAQRREHQQVDRAESDLAEYREHRRLLDEFYALVTPGELASPAGLDVGLRFRPAAREPMGAGDYYDLLPLDDGRYGICVADVSGKYHADVLKVPVVKYALKVAASLERRPARVVERVNDLVFHELQPDRFVTMFYAQVDRWNGELVYVNAGHDPPLLVRADGDIETLESGGLLLGVLREARFEEGCVRLAPGDALVLYTDGAVEALAAATAPAPPVPPARPALSALSAAETTGIEGNAAVGPRGDSGTELGARRLREIARRALVGSAAAQEVAQSILSQIEALAPPDQRRDDITILVARLTRRELHRDAASSEGHGETTPTAGSPDVGQG